MTSAEASGQLRQPLRQKGSQAAGPGESREGLRCRLQHPPAQERTRRGEAQGLGESHSCL